MEVGNVLVKTTLKLQAMLANVPFDLLRQTYPYVVRTRPQSNFKCFDRNLVKVSGLSILVTGGSTLVAHCFNIDAANLHSYIPAVLPPAYCLHIYTNCDPSMVLPVWRNGNIVPFIDQLCNVQEFCIKYLQRMDIDALPAGERRSVPAAPDVPAFTYKLELHCRSDPSV